MKLPGLIVAPLTPFNARDLSIDWTAHERQIDYICNDCKAAMVSVAGRRDVGVSLPLVRRPQELIRRTAEMVGKRSELVVGISHANTPPRSSSPSWPPSSARRPCRCWRRSGPMAASPVTRS